MPSLKHIDVPLGAFAGLRIGKKALGQASGGARYRGVYQNGKMIGWAWSTGYDANIVNQNAGCIASGLQVRDNPPGGWWTTIFRPSPTFNGTRQWFAVYDAPSRRFIGWYDIGLYTAQVMGRSCPNIDVFNRFGQPIR